VFVIGGRRLKGASQLNPNQALVEYAIRTNASEPWAVRDTIKRKLMASAAGFGMAQVRSGLLCLGSESFWACSSV
jgi:hypothetical protein